MNYNYRQSPHGYMILDITFDCKMRGCQGEYRNRTHFLGATSDEAANNAIEWAQWYLSTDKLESQQTEQLSMLCKQLDINTPFIMHQARRDVPQFWSDGIDGIPVKEPTTTFVNYSTHQPGVPTAVRTILDPNVYSEATEKLATMKRNPIKDDRARSATVALDELKCECGSGSNLVGPGHSYYCKCLRD